MNGPVVDAASDRPDGDASRDRPDGDVDPAATPSDTATTTASRLADDLADAVARGDLEATLAAADAVRDALEAALRGRRLTEGSLVLERRRRVRRRLDRVEEAVAAGDAGAAAGELDAVRSAVQAVLEEASELPAESARTRHPGPDVLRNVGTVAWKEVAVILQGATGAILFGLFLLTFAIGLEGAFGGSAVAGVEPSVALVWSYAHSLDFLSIPLAGILAGYALVNGERSEGTMHFLASKPLRREGLALGKWAGTAAALGVAVAVPALIVGGVAFAATGRVGDPAAVVGYVAATYVLALAFASLALGLSAVLDRAAASLGASFGVYVLLGPLWQNLFLLRSVRSGGATPPAGDVLLYLASPFTAWWNWTSEILGPRSSVLGLPVGEPWHAALVEAVERGVLDGLPFYAQQWWYVLVMALWCGAGLLSAMAVLRRRDLA